MGNPPSGAVSSDVLAKYRVAILVGPVKLRKDLKARLTEYVRAGGTLVVNAMQWPELPDDLKGGHVCFESGGVKVTIKDVGSGRVIAAPESDLLDESNKALPALGEILATIAAEVAPVRVRGDIQYHFLKTRTGWLVALMNNKGIVHHFRRKPEIDPSGAAAVELAYHGTVSRSVERRTGREVQWRETGGESRTDVRVEPGAIQIIELICE